jgi:hypothetical protein
LGGLTESDQVRAEAIPSTMANEPFHLGRIRSRAMNCSIPRGKLFKCAGLTAIALIVAHLFYARELIVLFFIFSALFASLAALLTAGVLLNHVAQLAFGWTNEQRSAFSSRLRRSGEHAEGLAVGPRGTIEAAQKGSDFRP